MHSFRSSDYPWDNNHEFKDVESFNLQTMSWQEETKFPFVPVALGTNIPYGNSFLSIGGTIKGNPWAASGVGEGKHVDFIYTVNIIKRFLSYTLLLH